VSGAARLRPAALLATWFGAGLLPVAPGTWGSLAALPFAWVIAGLGGRGALLAAALVAFAVGCWAAGEYERETGTKDPGAVVIDEVAGQWVTLAFVPLSLWSTVLGFVLFRVADIVKPWPASLAERRLAGGLGVMADDIVAGAYAGLALLAIDRLAT
jgi:phosphatidylglycerophosphatase A